MINFFFSVSHLASPLEQLGRVHLGLIRVSLFPCPHFAKLYVFKITRLYFDPCTNKKYTSNSRNMGNTHL